MTQSVNVVGRFVRTSSVKFAYSTSEDMSSPTLTGSPSAVGENHLAKATLTGLADDTEYWWQPATTAGVLFGKKSRVKTWTTSGPCSLSIILTSCQNSYNPTASDLSEPAWQKMLDLGPHDLIVQQGDWGYQGGRFDGTEESIAHINNYVSVIQGFQLMLENFLGCQSLIQVSDHETSNDNGDNNENAVPGGAITTTAIEAYQELMPIPVLDYADTNHPIKGRWFSRKLSERIKLISIDFRTLYRSLNSEDDGPDKTALGAGQLAWLFDELASDDSVLKIIACDNAWGPAASIADLGPGPSHQDKWWCYQYEQKVIADYCNNNLTEGSLPIYVDYWGGDRHALGILLEAENILADGTPCPWDALTASGSDKNQLTMVPGELYTESFGFKDEDDRTDGEPRQFGHILLSDDDNGTITRVFDGWNCVPDLKQLYVPQSYAPVKVLDGYTKTWNYTP